MIVEFLLNILLSVLSFILNFVFLPLKLVFPAVVFSDGSFDGFATFLFNTIRLTFNFFAYFSSVQVTRLLFFSAVFSLFSYPFLKIGIGLFKFLRKIF